MLKRTELRRLGEKCRFGRVHGVPRQASSSEVTFKHSAGTVPHALWRIWDTPRLALLRLRLMNYSTGFLTSNHLI